MYLSLLTSRLYPHRARARHLYRAAIQPAARARVFYRALGVADDLEGRFDMLLVHAVLIARRLARADSPLAAAFSQAVYDAMFGDLESALSQHGIGDMSLGKHVRRLQRAYNGRLRAYDRTLTGMAARNDEDGDGPAESLERAVARNLYGDKPADPRAPARMAAYMRIQARHLARRPDGELLLGETRFLAPAACGLPDGEPALAVAFQPESGRGGKTLDPAAGEGDIPDQEPAL